MPQARYIEANTRCRKLKLGHELPVELLQERIGDFRAILWAKNNPRGDTLGSKRFLDVVRLLCEHFMDVVVKMKLDRRVVLSDLHTQERFHAAASSDAEIL